MIVKAQHVAAVVKEVSAGADDPQHVASLVALFMQVQPTVGHYVSAHSNDLGLEGVVLTLLRGGVDIPLRLTEASVTAAGDLVLTGELAVSLLG